MSDVRVERRDDAPAVAEIVWDGGDLNLFTTATASAFEDVLDALPGDARAVLLRAEGRVFCGGLDVTQLTELDATSGTALMQRLIGVCARLEALPVPTVVAVHALNLTIGLELALACDVIVTAPGVRMGLVEAKVGLTPGAGGTQRLVARAGLGRATEMVFSGDTYLAEDLLAWGVVDRIASDDLLGDARATAARLAAGPTVALAAGKRLLRAAATQGVAAADAITAATVGALFGSADVAIGVDAIRTHQRDTVRFTGR